MTATIRNKIFNYKQTVKSIEVDEGMSLYPFNFEKSEFCDPDYGQTIRGSASY